MNPSRTESQVIESPRSRRLRLLWLLLIVLVAIPCAAQAPCDYTVTSLADSGAGSLRAGLADSAVTNICFSVTGTITLSSPLQVLYPVTITDPGGVTISGNNQVGILVIIPSSATDAIRFNGFTLTNGNATAGNNIYGGAVWVQQGNVTFVGTVMTNNTATSGGAVYNSGTLTLSGCGIRNNTATGSGGGIVNNEGASLTLQTSDVSSNSASSANGGGLDNFGTAQIQGGFFTSNQATYGGAIYNEAGGQLPFTGGTAFNSNTASVDGGAIYNNSTTNITQALFNGNAVASNIDVAPMGGAFYNNGTATISESTFYANTSSGYGGAIEQPNYYSSLTLNDDTISGNSATALGSGLDIEGLSAPTINNTIIAGNTPIAGAVNSDCNGCTLSNGTGNLIGVTVELGPLAVNGGPTETMMPLPGGSAIGAGNPTAAAGEDVDQRGFSRFNSDGTLDVGAVQSHYTSVAFLTQPSNTGVNSTITPAVAVQVVETDPGTSKINYPVGIPVTVSLINSQSNPVTGVLSGTLTQSTTNHAGVVEAVFPDLSVNATGSYQLFATDAISGNSSSANPVYNATSNAFQIAVPVTLSWQPAPLTYGPMPQSELNAVATVNGSPGVGTYVYTFVGTGATINVGQIYPVGTYQVQVAFTPAGTTATYTLQTAMQITQAKPVLTWPTPAAIYTSTPLGSAQLDATAAGVTGAALPGTFVYSPAAGTKLTAGQQVLSTTFTPTDTTDYTTATGSVTIQVNAVAAGTVTIQDSANPITFGQSETFTAAVTGTDGQPFSGGTASFTVDGAAIGSAQIVNGSGAVSDAALTGGTHQVGVSFSSTPSSQPLTASTTITVNKATPALTWPTPAAIYTSTPLSGTQLDAAATGVGGTALAGSFVYTPAAGATLPAGSQTLSTTFTPTDTVDYNTNTAQVSIQVNAPTAGTIAIQESANPITYGQSETFTAAVTGTDGKPLSGGTATFTVDGAGIGSASVVNGSGSVSDATLTGGTHQVGVSYTNTTTNQTLTATATITVNKATPVLTWATPAAIYTSTPLSATQLNASAAGVTGAALAGTFVYTPAAGTMLTAGAHALSTTFTPTDTTDYNSNTAQVTIQVNAPTAGTIAIQESANPITFGQSETFTVAVTGTDGKPLSGGTATFTVDGTGIGSAAVVNGSGSVSDAALTAGTHQVAVSYTNTTTNQTLTAAATLTVNKATPVLAWATPAAIYTSTALSATQLNATATGVTGAALPGTFVYNPAAGTTLTAGSHVLATTFTPTDTTDYNTNTAQVTIQVNAPTAGTVAIQESANPITYGQSETFTVAVTGSDGKPLSGGTATFSVDGTGIGSAAVVNGSGSVSDAALTAGSHQVGVSYTNTTTNQTLTATATLTVNKATPVLAWATPAAIYTSTALSATQLNATATGVTGAALPGTFAYNPAAGTTLAAGAHVLATTFTPTDSTDYNTNTAQVTIQVNTPTAGTVAIQESANPITYGQSETFTVAVTGSDGKPLSGGTATFTVDGTGVGSAAVVNGSGSVSDATLTAGTHQVGVSYTNTTTNLTLTATATLTVNKATPVLAWATPAAIYTSTPLSATQLNASAASVTGTALAGKFVYNPAAGTTLTAGAHLLAATFTPTDTTDYNPNTAQVTIQVNAPTAGTIAIQESANPITYGQSETFTVAVTGSDGKPLSGGTATFSVDGTGIGSAAVVNGSGSVSDATLAAGSHQVGVSYTNTTTNQTLTATATLTVNKASPVLVWATPAAIYTSTALSATQLNATATGVTGAALPGTFVYNPAAGTTLSAGAHLLATTFTPTDTTNYNTNTAQVTIQVNTPTAGTIAIQESANPITYGQSETFTVAVTGSDGKPLSGGTATFSVDGTGIGSAAVVNGSGSVSDATLTAGSHQVGVSYTDTTTNQTLTASATLTVNKATPVLVWATPASIYTSTPLSATQLNATATGVTGTALAGTFVYNPAAGTTLAAGAHLLATTFTPTDTTDYNTNTAQVTIQVNAPTAGTIAIQESANPITYGQSETFTVAVTGSDGKPLSGGTATISVDGTGIGSASVVNGSGSVTDTSLTAGSHQVSVSYTNTTTNQTLTASATLTVNKATPVLKWATPAAIYTSTPLSATQLNASAAGVTGAPLAGTFVYSPAAGTTLAAGPHVLAATFTPTDTTDYNTNTAQVTVQVNTATAATVIIQESANPITFGKSETLTATVTGSDGQPSTGGTASFTSDGTAIGSAPVANGSASISISSLTAGVHQIAVSYTNSTLSAPLTGSAALTVNKAAPVLAWATPATIFTVTPLSSTQLDATATGVNGAALPGTFVYSPAAGTLLPQGAQTLSTTFTPADTTNYTTATAQVIIQVGYSTISIAAVSPGTAQLGTTPLPITITGSGFTATAVVEINGTAVATKVQNSTTLTAAIPAADLVKAGTLSITVYDSASKFSSNVVQFAITAPAANFTLSITPTTASGEQPTIDMGLNSPYPLDLQGTLTLTFSPSGNNSVDDPAIQFSTGGRTFTFTVPAGTTTTPQVALQTGTVAGTITVTLTLTAGGVDVTPQGLAPITLVIAASAPVITSVTFTSNNQGLITVVVSGFSNTRDASQAEFVFTGKDASRLHSSKVDVPVTGLFGPWYSSSDSDQYGSEFTYTQNFQLSKPDSGITGVSVTLANSAGTSGSVNSQ